MPPAAQGGGGQSDNSAGILWGVAAIFATIGIVWYLFKKYLISFYLLIKLYEVHVLSYITGSAYFEQLTSILNAAIKRPSMVTFKDAMLLGSSVGDYVRYPLIVIFVILGFTLFFNNSARIFRRIYSMTTLAKLEKDNWPQITPVIGLDLLKEDINKGKWAMGMTPMQFCKSHRLIAEVRPERSGGIQREGGNIDVVLLRGQTNKVFAMQLGPIFRDIRKLPPHVQALFAVFAARINADSKTADKLLRQMNTSSTGTMDFSGVQDVLKKYEKSKIVQSVIRRHAYVYTVMVGMLEEARQDGVVASADFLWLKPRDRRLWYTLNSVGRQTPFAEVGGIFAHFLAEKEAGRKLFVPMVGKATNALEIALQEIIYKPDEE